MTAIFCVTPRGPPLALRGTPFDRSRRGGPPQRLLLEELAMHQSLLLAGGLAIVVGSGALASRVDNPQAQDQNTTTVTGCVTASADGKTFTLTESNAASMARPKNWTLVATGGVDLSKYANHKVEVTGTA